MTLLETIVAASVSVLILVAAGRSLDSVTKSINFFQERQTSRCSAAKIRLELTPALQVLDVLAVDPMGLPLVQVLAEETPVRKRFEYRELTGYDTSTGQFVPVYSTVRQITINDEDGLVLTADGVERRLGNQVRDAVFRITTSGVIGVTLTVYSDVADASLDTVVSFVINPRNNGRF